MPNKETTTIPSKTELIGNPDDFFQTACGIAELTVTITLHEYRELVTEVASWKAENLHMQEKLEETGKRLEEAERKVTLAEYYRKEAERRLSAYKGENNGTDV